MRKTNNDWLGDGFSQIHFWVFNTLGITVWLALHLLQMFAVIGIGTIYLTSTGTPTPLENMGYAFVNLIYGMSLLFLTMWILITWFIGNVYIVRKELYTFLESYFGWGDL